MCTTRESFLMNYKRITVKDSCYYDERDKCDIDELYARLEELENRIDKGSLIDRYFLETDPYGFCCACEISTDSGYYVTQYRTKAEARKAIEEAEKQEQPLQN